MSIFKSNKFFRVIKHFILALPLMFVLGVSLYAIVNPNAKDSYSGDTLNENENITINYNDLILDEKYYLTNSLLTGTYTQTSQTRMYLQVLSIEGVSYTEEQISNMAILAFYVNANQIPRLYFYDSNFNAIGGVIDLNNINVKINYVFKGWNNVNNNLPLLNDIDFYYVLVNQYSYINNAFEYGMYQFTQIGFGQFDFIGLFNGIFTTNINNVYASFINDYINYYLFVEVIYFAPWVFHAFIHFAYDLGDYFTSSFKRNRKDDD